jgi:hypothetical protein
MTTPREFVRERTGRIVKIIMMVLVFAPIAILLFGQSVHYLWNWLMPALFQLPAITFWQALGLLGLSWLLFGGLRGRGPRSGYRRSWRHRMHDRWEHMSPEEREKFREWLESRCGAQPE